MKNRASSGQAMIVLVLLLAVFVLLAIGLFSFELNRMEVARQQLRSACEAASLAGAATLASSDNTDPMASHTAAMNTALTAFRHNSVIGKSLIAGDITYSNPDNPTPNNSSIYIQFLDPNNNNTPVAMGDPKGKTVQVTANFGLPPSFGQFLHIGNAVLHETTSGGVPSIDVALCFDVSASIDDQTLVTFVRRTWNSGQNKINYTIPTTLSGCPAGPIAEGTIYDILVPQPTGTAVDSVPPQSLEETNYPGTNQYPLAFSERSGRTGSAVGLRGTPNAGSAPGNYPGGGTMGGNNQTFTDLVVNIDGNKHFGGMASGAYNFPDLATLVEAARGNLENNTVFTSSKANLSVPNTIRPTAGYQAEYMRLAAANLHPLHDAQVACQEFLTIMNTNTDAHFCLVAFTSNAGTGPSSSSYMNMPNVDSVYAAGGSSNFPIPMIPLNTSATNTGYSTCFAELPKTGPVSGTNIGDAVNTGLNQIKTNGRAGAKKFIIVFTDGQPTSAGPLDTSDPWRNARLAADKCRVAGCPIYTIGLAQTPAIIPGETQILNDTNNNATTGGIAAIAGNGGKFFLVTKASDLRATFENIARQLVQLVR
jgi:hypothetical protein